MRQAAYEFAVRAGVFKQLDLCVHTERCQFNGLSGVHISAAQILLTFFRNEKRASVTIAVN